MHFPPAFWILALAVSVNLRATMLSLGTERVLTSSVTVPTWTTTLSLRNKKIGLLVSLQVLDDSGDRNGGLSGVRVDQSSQNSFDKFGISSSGQESE